MKQYTSIEIIQNGVTNGNKVYFVIGWLKKGYDELLVTDNKSHAERYLNYLKSKQL